jgi:hypothetical protein
MCYTIDSENILMNYFVKAESKEITFRSLRTIRRRIEEDFGNAVYVDITYNSLRDAVTLHQEIFNMELTKISINTLKSNKLNNEFIEKTINYKIPKSIKERYLQLLSSSEDRNE